MGRPGRTDGAAWPSCAPGAVGTSGLIEQASSRGDVGDQRGDPAAAYRGAYGRVLALTAGDGEPSIVGSLGRTGSPRVVAATTLAFLDTTLRHTPGDLADALSTYDDLSVYRPGNSNTR